MGYLGDGRSHSCSGKLRQLTIGPGGEQAGWGADVDESGEVVLCAGGDDPHLRVAPPLPWPGQRHGHRWGILDGQIDHLRRAVIVRCRLCSDADGVADSDAG